MAEKQATLWLKIKSEGEKVISDVEDKLGSVFNASNLVIGGFAALGAAIVKGVMEFKEKEAAINSLNQAMVNTGMFTSKLKAQYLEEADALSKVSLYQDEQIIKAQAIIQAQIGNHKVTKELTQATMDLAAAKGIDLATAADMVGKTIGGETNVLKKSGIQISENVSLTTKYSQVIDEINKKFHGQAEAATQGLGSLDKLKMVVLDLLSSIGERLAPYVELVSKRFIAMADSGETVEAALDGIDFGIRSVINGIDILYTATKTTFNAIVGHVTTASMAIWEMMNGNFKKALEIGKTGYTQIGQDIVKEGQSLWDRINAIDQARLAKKQETTQKEIDLTKEANDKKNAVVDEQLAKESAKKLEQQITEEQIRQGAIVAEEQKTMAILQMNQKLIDEKLKLATTAGEKQKLLEEKFANEQAITKKKKDEMEIQNRKDTLGVIAGMQNSSNKTLATIGKAAAITQIAIDTPVAISKALASAPPPFNFALAGLVGAAMAAQAANIAGVQLAQGGVVMPRPGGVQATIAEAGQAEAVIPLDKFPGLGGGTTIQIVVNGGLLGDQSSAYEFAKAVDRELLKLRQNNESQAFDGIIV